MNQIQDFLNALRMQDWKASGGPMRLSHKLEAADYTTATLPANVRLIMERVGDGVPATAGGNLNRAFVEGIFESLHIPPAWRNTIRAVNKVLNEVDVSDLHLARVVAEGAGFLAIRKKRFHLTQKGKKLLAPEQVGEFYRELFLGYFRRFNLGYWVNLMKDVPAIQETFPAILWRMDAVLKDWTPVAGLAPQILLPKPLARIREVATPYINEEWLLAGYVYEPLRRMGLIEKEGEGSAFGIEAKNRIKTSSLWRKFLWFDWQP